MKIRLSPAWTAPLLATFVLMSTNASAQDPDLSAARDLYASAAYDDALAVLNRLKSSAPMGQARTIEQYRAFCLLALGRTADAEQAIEAVVAAEPSYQPAEGDVSPRVRTAFADVRRRMLPTIIQQQYAQAKSAFDRKEFAAAASGFSQVLVMMADPGVAAEAMRPPLSDMRMLAVGFEELSATAAAPPPPPPPPPAPVVPVVPEPPAPPRIYAGEDRNVVAPVALVQVLPSFPGPVGIVRSGKLEVVINEAGIIETAAMTDSVTTNYDRLALAATKSWRYTPATVNGVPVKFRKIVQINIKPTVDAARNR